MKLVALMVITTLCAISSVECGCSDESRSISYPDSNIHVHCIQYKSSDCLHCKANGNYLKCDTQPAESTDPAADKGPAPSGTYAIGPVYTHGTHEISWANLYPEKKNRNGWWDYYRANLDAPGSRSHIGLHPGTLSNGCVTVTDGSCWSKIESMLNSKSGDYITVSRTWWRTKTVNRIGFLEAMD